MLSPGDLLLVVGATAVCTGAVNCLAYLLLRLNRRGSITSQFAIVLMAAVISIACSCMVALAQMYLSPNELVVFGWVLGVSAAMSLGAVWLVTGRIARASIATLVDTAQRIGDGDVVEPPRPGWRELDGLAEQLADASERLAAARAELDRLDGARRQFFAWISHDLRTPLAGVRAMAEALEEGVAEDPPGYIRLIRAKADTMNRMVDDLFELSKLESGTLRLHPEPVVLLDLVSDAVSDVQALAGQRDVRITHAGVAGHMLWADPREMTRAIGNLLTNGIRHAPDGSEILISAHARDDGHLVLSVLDHGSGVASEDLGRMFDIGWRANEARTAEAAAHGSTGAGLGLAIVRGIVEAHGGDVRAHHAPDGFCLDLILPRGPVQEDQCEPGLDRRPSQQD